MSEEKEIRYNLAIKLKQIDRDGRKFQEPSDAKWGVREEYFSIHRANVRKIKCDVSNKIYRAFNDCVTYGGKTRNVKASFLRRALKYEEVERLCMFPRKKNSAGTRYFIITHPLKYSGFADDGSIKTVFQLNDRVSNHNYLNNALVIDLDELKKLFSEIKEDWQKETTLLEYQSDNESKVKKILDKSYRLKLAVEEGIKNLDVLKHLDKNTLLTEEVLDMYNLSKNKSFLKNLGGDYIESTWQAWDNIDKVSRDIQIYQNKITYNYTDYMDSDYELSLSALQKAKHYIAHEDNEFPQIENRHSYNNVLKCYDKVNVDSLPKIDEYYRLLMELEALKIKIEQQKATMTKRMLLFLKPKGDVVLWGKK